MYIRIVYIAFSLLRIFLENISIYTWNCLKIWSYNIFIISYYPCYVFTILIVFDTYEKMTPNCPWQNIHQFQQSLFYHKASFFECLWAMQLHCNWNEKCKWYWNNFNISFFDPFLPERIIFKSQDSYKRNKKREIQETIFLHNVRMCYFKMKASVHQVTYNRTSVSYLKRQRA